MFDTDREQIRKNYQLCRFGFGNYGAALLVAAVTAVIGLLAMFRVDQVRWILVQPWYRWLDTIVWLRLIGGDRALGTLEPEELAAQSKCAAGAVHGRPCTLGDCSWRSTGIARG